MVIRSTTNEHQTPAPLDLGNVILMTNARQLSGSLKKNERPVPKLLQTYFNTSQRDRVIPEVQAPPHRVHHGLGLLKDFFLHEVLVIALHDLLDLDLQSGDLSRVGIIHAPTKPMDAEGTLFHSSHIVVLITEDTKCYLLFDSVSRALNKKMFCTSKNITRLVCSMTALASEAKKYSTSLSSRG